MDYISLADLQAMSPDALLDHWFSGAFPFDLAKGCNSCLVQHDWPNDFMCKCQSHAGLQESARELKPSTSNLAPYLERIYALRLFYRDLYASNPPELDAIPNTSVTLIKEEVSV